MNQHHQASWHSVIPTRTMAWEDGPDETAVLLVPRFRSGLLARWLQPKLRRPHIRVKLDDIGSHVWKHLDGKNTFTQIVSSMKERFGERVEPAETRLQTFLTQLYRDKFILLFTPGQASCV